MGLPPVIGHRGAAGRAPENTLAGFRRAKELGCTWVECDVRLTRDGVPVLCHDSRLDRTTDGDGLVAAASLAAVRGCDAGNWFSPAFVGERVPILEETLLLAAELGLGVNIEIKSERGRDYATAAAVVTALRRLHGRLPPLLVSSFQPVAVATMCSLAPEVPRAMLFRFVPRGWAAAAASLGCIAVGADHRRLRSRSVAAVRAAGFQLAAFTVNSAARARLLYEWGVTSVFSDVPDIILLAGARRRLPREVQRAESRTGAAAARQGATG